MSSHFGLSQPWNGNIIITLRVNFNPQKSNPTAPGLYSALRIKTVYQKKNTGPILARQPSRSSTQSDAITGAWEKQDSNSARSTSIIQGKCGEQLQKIMEQPNRYCWRRGKPKKVYTIDCTAWIIQRSNQYKNAFKSPHFPPKSQIPGIQGHRGEDRNPGWKRAKIRNG